MENKKIYALFEGNKILRMSYEKKDLVEYRNSFPDSIRRKMFIAEKGGVYGYFKKSND